MPYYPTMQDMLREVYDYLWLFYKRPSDTKRIEEIITAMRIADRKFFVDSADEAYLNNALPVGKSQTISQPSTVARMLMLAELFPDLDVLEVGSASGWNGSLLAYLVYHGKVLSIEVINTLSEKAKANLNKLKTSFSDEKIEKFKNLEFKTTNFFNLTAGKKFDRVIITAGITPDQEKKIELAAKNLLRDNGILICPYSSGPMVIFKKHNSQISKSYTPEAYAFVPLVNH
ncbi:MAG: hypothetical protein V1860_00040 [bacterium]